MGFIPYDRNQIDLLGYCLDDFVPGDAKCRYVVELVNRLDLTSLIERYSTQGADSFDPVLMLATWFFSYSEGESSTRRIEEKCYRDTHYMYMSANLRPDHTSLSRFRKTHLDLMSDYFVQLVQMAQADGVSDFKEISTDGSKFQASCSSKQNKSSDALQKKIDAIRSDIDAYMARCDLAEINDLDEDDIKSIREKIKQLEAKEQLLKERQDQLEERKKELKPESRDKHTINLVEPDAPMMSKIDGAKGGAAYNCQVSVDVDSYLILANDTVQDRNDKNQFLPQFEMINNNLGYDPHRKYNSDSGYFNLEPLEYIFENNIDAVFNDPSPQMRSSHTSVTPITELVEQDRKLTRSDFRYDSDGNYYECPAGRKLPFVRRKKETKSCYDLYRCDNCEGCSLQEKCLGKRNASKCRNIRRDTREPYAERMSDILKSENAKERLKHRAMTVEPVFGNLKENLGFRRFHLRGLSQVKGEFNLMCIGHNINILFKCAKKRAHQAIEAKVKVEKLFLNIFDSCFSIIFTNFRPKQATAG
ncbi:IS1182 family transposase [candidate division KSB1 bacterium]|nr:IS1182 family transposase [candidate division KSB1 bacterium]